MTVKIATREETVDVGEVPITVVRGGEGPPLLVLHDELGYPGWMSWNDQLADRYEIIVPLQPAYGHTPKVDWIGSYRDLAGFYARMAREQGWTGAPVIGFSAGAYVAAEMAAACPSQFSRMVLVGPLGLRPTEGEIFDFLAVTVRTHVAATVTKVEAPEFARIYGGEMTPLQFELFEDARAETARLGWEPFMFNPSLGHLLAGIGDLPTLLIRGADDLIAPQGCITAYEAAIPNTTTVSVAGAGHRPEIEDPEAFLSAVTAFLGA
ncbi:MAG: alpha/beta fold hydrolase [Acidimicrobiales bacterium]